MTEPGTGCIIGLTWRHDEAEEPPGSGCSVRQIVSLTALARRQETRRERGGNADIADESRTEAVETGPELFERKLREGSVPYAVLEGVKGGYRLFVHRLLVRVCKREGRPWIKKGFGDRLVDMADEGWKPGLVSSRFKPATG